MKEEVSIYLDALRLSAALAVLAEHSSDYIGGWIWRFASFGAEAVAVFFVLSGFVIAHVCAQRENSASKYAGARALRMYSVVIPAVLFTLLFDSIGQHLNAAVYQASPYTAPSLLVYLRSLTFTHQLWHTDIHFGSNGPFWSLGFEVAYYVIFGVAFFVTNKLYRAVGVLLLLLLCGPRIVAYLPLWLMGVGTYSMLYGRWNGALKSFSRIPPIAWCLLLLATVIAFLLVHRFGHATNSYLKIYRRFELTPAVFGTLAYFYLLGTIVAVHIVTFAFAAQSNWLAAIVASVRKPIRWLAGGTFTIYLLNLPVLLCLKAVFFGWDGGEVKLTLVMTLTIAICLLCAELSERRKSNMKHWFAKLFGARTPQVAPNVAP